MNVPVDMALTPPPIVREAFAPYTCANRLFQGIPSIACAPSGRLWAVWYAGGKGEGPENYVVVATSQQAGAPWTEPVIIVDPPNDVRAFDPQVWLDPKGRLWVFWAQAFSWWDGRGGVWAIVTDEPDSASPQWSEPRRLCDGVMMGKPITVSDGSWLLPVAVWGVPPNSRIRFEAGENTGAWVIASPDEGQTWLHRGKYEAPHRSFDEHMLLEHSNGTLAMFVRTRRGIASAISRDSGRTWQAAPPPSLPHVDSRFFIGRLRSGAILAVVNASPDGKTRSHLSAFLSVDEGESWLGGLVLDERRDVSYPDAVELPDGRICIIYDRERTGAREILAAIVTEAPIKAGGRVLERFVVSRGGAAPADSSAASAADE